MDHANGSAFDIAPFNMAATSQTKENWLDMLRGRLGFAWASNMRRGITWRLSSNTCVRTSAV
jgi:hypothetical protein